MAKYSNCIYLRSACTYSSNAISIRAPKVEKIHKKAAKLYDKGHWICALHAISFFINIRFSFMAIYYADNMWLFRYVLLQVFSSAFIRFWWYDWCALQAKYIHQKWHATHGQHMNPIQSDLVEMVYFYLKFDFVRL